jgi:hypothetical protein
VWLDDKHCQAIKPDGRQCQSWPNKKGDSVYCFGHMRQMAILDGIDAALKD